MIMKNDEKTAALSNLVLLIRKKHDNPEYAEDRSVYDSYMAYAAIILAKAVQEAPLQEDIDSMERVFGRTWLKSEESYREIYQAWDKFKKLLTQSIQGMTVNERLFTLGLLEEYDNAAMSKDKNSLCRILRKCLLSEENIQAIINREFKV